MTGALSAVFLGLLLGLQHATDPDHLVAVATIVSRRPRFLPGALLGALWGVGHSATVLAVGGAIILLNLTITPALGLGFELVAAAMLVVLGAARLAWTLGGERVSAEHARAAHDHGGGEAFHSHAHAHGETTHAHPHLHPSGALQGALQQVGAGPAWRSIGIGVIHGLAGSAAIALLVLSTIRDPAWAVVYLVVFGVGTILGMTAITAALTLPLALTARRFVRLNRALAFGTGTVSLCLGVFLIYEIGVVRGLLTN